ncbi:arginine ABC transporter permease ArtQ [Dongshaea marina]|uniref:arginine ABC transporter permease ArtQ n=1 Tax=Dongshaea marina TaxID=2047966 RepID=UPI000D3E7BC6|nr:arginine ABC transporter permease ArtQ [Dongshaea marina]
MLLSGYSLTLVKASVMTLQIAVSSLLLGLLLAIVFALLEMTRARFIAWPATALVTMLRGLPELLVVLFIYFGSSQILYLIFGTYIDISPFVSGSIALSLIFAAYASQTLRGALKAVPQGQRESARALGMNRIRTLQRIILPQTVMHALPGLTNQWLVLLKDTALVSLIGVTDLMRQAQLSAATTHDSFTWYLSAALIYLVITLLTQRLIKLIDKKFQIKGLSAA